MVNLKSMKVNLPTATTATPEASAKDFADVSVDKAGVIYLDKRSVAAAQLTATLASARQANPQLRVLISGDVDARHGDVIRALNCVRAAGVEKVAFEIRLRAASDANGSFQP